MITLQDQQYMTRAIQLARNGLYSTDPNPRVGCVLVKHDQIIGEGCHIRAGEGHAEVNALADVQEQGNDPQGATAYVTLEPCSHYGRTPPCSEALVKAGVSRVVCAMEDPNPQVAGKGFDILRSAGIEVECGIQENEAWALNPGFFKRMQTGLPLVRIKLAMSVDGRTAMASGESQWITGPAARSDVQKLRARSSVVVTGIESILKDDSSLTVRESELGLEESAAKLALEKQPIRVVLDSRGRIPSTAKILSQPGQTLIATGMDTPVDQAETDILRLQQNANGKLDLTELLKALAEKQCNEVLVETGATLAGEFVQQDLADELVVYMAPCLMGSDARPLLSMPFTAMAQKKELLLKDVRQIGDDIRLTYSFKKVK